ncbi:tetratricopeptide repeat protein [Pseudoxanthomonas mexicana]
MPFHRTIAAYAAVSLLACASVASAADRRVQLELINDSDAPIVGVSVERTSVFSSKTFGGGEIELDRPLAPGQSRTFDVSIGEHHDTMPYAMRWRWTPYGSCRGSAAVPGQGDAFSVRSGAAECRNGKPLPIRRTDGRDALLADAQRSGDVDEAKDLYAVLLARNPDDVDVLHARAHSLIQGSKTEFGDYLSEEAIADLQRALRLSTAPSARLHYHRDLMSHLLNHKRWKEALPHIDALVAGQPDTIDYLLYRTFAYCELGDIAKATQDERLLEQKAGQALPADKTCAARKAAGKG